MGLGLPQAADKNASASSAEVLAKVGTDLNLIANELDKLILYTGDEATITEDDVFAVTSTPPDQLEHGGIFDLTDAVSARDVDRFNHFNPAP